MKWEAEYMRNSMLRSIFSLAWPTMLEQFSQTVVQYADTAMVGTLGTAATAAVGAIWLGPCLRMGVSLSVRGSSRLKIL